MGRRGAHGAGIRPSRPARLLRELAASGRASGIIDVHGSPGFVRGLAVAGGLHRLGLARPLLPERTLDSTRFAHSATHLGDAVVPGAADAKPGCREPAARYVALPQA